MAYELLRRYLFFPWVYEHWLESLVGFSYIGIHPSCVMRCTQDSPKISNILYLSLPNLDGFVLRSFICTAFLVISLVGYIYIRLYSIHVILRTLGSSEGSYPIFVAAKSGSSFRPNKTCLQLLIGQGWSYSCIRVCYCTTSGGPSWVTVHRTQFHILASVCWGYETSKWRDKSSFHGL